MPLLEPFLQSMRMRKVLKSFTKRGVLVDVGCSNPPLLLHKMSPRMEYCIGIDEVGKYSKKGNIETFCQKIHSEIKIESETADYVTMLAVLEHLKNPQKIIQESYRILKKDGKLLITVPSPASKPVLEVLGNIGLVRREMIDQHENYFVKQDLVDMIRNAGFKHVKAESFELGFNTFVEAIK